MTIIIQKLNKRKVIQKFIEEQKKRLDIMYKELHSEGEELSIEDLNYDEGYINGSRYLLKKLTKIIK